MAENVFDIGIGTAVDNKGLKKGLNAAQNNIKSFAGGVSKSLSGIDFTKLLVPGAVIGVAIAALGKLKGALDEAAAAYRVQEQAEAALQNAAKNNPYLNENSVRQLNQFASEMQRITGLDSDMITQTQTRLASLGRNQQQIQSILKTAADMAASGVMSFDEAINELSNSLNGTVRTAGRLYPELKNLSAEALASGQAIEIIGQKVSGSAERAMQTGAGSVTAYKNALGDLKKIYGEDWENATRGFRNALTEIVNRYVDTKNAIKDIKAAYDILNKSDADTAEILNATVEALNSRITFATDRMDRQLAPLWQKLLFYNDTLLKNTDQVVTRSKEYVDLSNSVLSIYKEQSELMNDINNIIENTTQNSEINNMAVEVKKELLEEISKISSDVNAADAVSVEQMRTVLNNLTGLNNEFKQSMKDRLSTLNEIVAKEDKRLKDETSAADFRRENQKALDEQIRAILLRAEIEGKTKDDLSVQKQILDAQVTAYENLLVAAKDVIDGTAPEEQAQLARLKERWRLHGELVKDEKEAEEARKKRLDDINKLQDDIQSEGKRLLEIKTEQEIQDEINKIRDSALVARLEKEAELRDKQRAEQEAKDKEALKKALDDELITQASYNKSLAQLEDNYRNQRLIAEQELAKAIEQANIQMWQNMLSEAQKYLDAAGSIANSISTIWTNNIDWETNEKLKANDAMVQSDEERAAKEKKIQIEAANERYKAELFAWSANVIMATAQASMAALTAYTEGLKGGGVAAPAIAAAMMALAIATGGMNVAAIISARPQRPRFHSGGQVQGGSRQEVDATLLGKEVVMTNRQFQNQMKVTNELANMKSGGGVVMNVNVENNAANDVSVSQQMNAGALEIVITKIVDKQLSSGNLNDALSRQQANRVGSSFL